MRVEEDLEAGVGVGVEGGSGGWVLDGHEHGRLEHGGVGVPVVQGSIFVVFRNSVVFLDLKGIREEGIREETRLSAIGFSLVI